MKRVLAALLLTTAGCAWSNPVNRPVWNAFERNLVPEHDAAFYATLPLSVPAGFGAILLDSVVVHPASVIDDAAGDAADSWRGLDWRNEYYTELAFTPLRVVWTPLKFVFSWLGRSCFDIEPREDRSPAAIAAAARIEAGARRAECLAFLAAVERNDPAASLPKRGKVEWDPELSLAFERARHCANAHGRLTLFRTAALHEFPPLVEAPWIGLRDADAVVRYLELQRWSGGNLPADLRSALLADGNDLVRMLAAEKLRE